VVAHSFDEALATARSENPAAVSVVGGAEIYKAALPHADRIELTQVHRDVSGDTHLPPFDKSAWRETARDEHTTGDGLRFSYLTLVRA
jgi:dihydrofolate reductase